MNGYLSREQVDDLLDYIGVEKRRWKANGDSCQFCCPIHNMKEVINIISKRIKDLTGLIFSRLRVVMDYDIDTRDKSIIWLCECSCGSGKKVYATGTKLKRGDIQSCGCYRIERSRKYNKYKTLGNIAFVYDTKGLCAIIDKEHLEAIKSYFWFKTCHGYTVTHTKHKRVVLRMHRFLYEKFVSKIPRGYEVDHINRCKHNNLLRNLRLATRAENNINRQPNRNNTTGYVGVSFSKQSKKYHVILQ